MAWDPRQYDLFQAARTRPGHDLMAALPPLRPARIVDLGCGSGRLTVELAERHPGALVVGLDSAPGMLAQAAHADGRISWQLGDIGGWNPSDPVDLIFSNAALHWLDDHATLFPRLVARLAPGGVLAVQMPVADREAPFRALLHRLAAEGPWAPRLAGRLRPEAVHPPVAYQRWLAPLAARVDIWTTEYLHVLDGPDPVLEWTRATALLPVLDALDGAEREAFLAAYAEGLRALYPPEADGRTLFPFRRLFIVATARG